MKTISASAGKLPSLGGAPARASTTALRWRRFHRGFPIGNNHSQNIDQGMELAWFYVESICAQFVGSLDIADFW
jgi:hypothetical protein